MWLRRIGARNVRNLLDERVDLDPRLNVFFGRNAQGKTSVLETVGLISRGRSFRTEQTRHTIRRGASALLATGLVAGEGNPSQGHQLELELRADGRALRLDGHAVRAAEYFGRLDVVVYSGERLRIIHGGRRARRQFIDRGAAALWPSYRALLRDMERVTQQRSACLERGGKGLEAWDESLVAVGAQVRARRARYVESLHGLLDTSFMPDGEDCQIASSHPEPDEERQRERLEAELQRQRPRERAARRSLVGPQRDEILLRVAGEEASQGASSGQARSLVLALVLASLELHRAERHTAAVALLDDLDSELDEERSQRFCGRVVELAQVLVTTAHPAWARGLPHGGRLFEVEGGRVHEAS